MDNSVYYVWLSLALGPQNPRYSALLAAFGNAKDIYDEEDYIKRIPTLKLSETQLRRLNNKNLDKAMEICAKCVNGGYGILTYHDRLFPDRLKIISSPPPLLYYRGKLKNLNEECLISLVGTRSMTNYGRQVTRQFSRAFAASGAVVVSGMAKGVDSEAHSGCLEENGYTVAVLGTGIDNPYPKESVGLYHEIIKRGLVISEFYPGSPAHAHNFPIRNRVISGISSATVITEAGSRSGALITAKLAIMQGKDVFALPGLTGSEQSTGTNMLLQKGVSLAYRPSDVLSKLELVYPDKIHIPASAYKTESISPFPKSTLSETIAETPKKPQKPSFDMGELEPMEKAIVTLLKSEAGGLIPDAIIEKTLADPSDVLSSLTVLEIYNIVVEDEFGKYSLKS